MFDYIWHFRLRRPYRLHVRRFGDPKSPTIVLLHGIAASSDDWQELIKLLEPRFYCVTIDVLGFGQSPKPQVGYEYTMEQHMSSIAYTIRTARIPRPFILAGHSLGSFLATRYALQHPRAVSRLLLLSPPVYPPLSEIKTRRAYIRTDLLLRIYKFLRSHPKMTPENMKKLSYIVPVPKSVSTHPDTWLPFCKTLEHCIEQQTIRSDIAKTRAPVDIFYGSLDAVVIPYNVRSLTRHRDVTLHSFRGNHSIGRIYARVVARVLESSPDT